MNYVREFIEEGKKLGYDLSWNDRMPLVQLIDRLQGLLAAGVTTVEIDSDEGSITFEFYRLETAEEQAAREKAQAERVMAEFVAKQRREAAEYDRLRAIYGEAADDRGRS